MVCKKVIGALHYSPLIGYKDFTSYEIILEKAKEDLKAFQEGGVNMVIVENNYNLPHAVNETNGAIEMMLKVTKELIKYSKIDFGISVLWNDYHAAFKIAKETKAKFIRVPVFVDSVETDFGKIIADPDKVIKVRNNLNANQILIYADVQVKHAKMLDKNKTLQQSIKEVKKKGADGIIITGKWTGDAPLINDLKIARKIVGEDFPIIIGSGADKNNINQLFEIADEVIVSTSLKYGNSKETNEERNLKSYNAKINVNKVKEFMRNIEK